ncbi:MAG: DUF1543 domain-containing protein [Bacteroidetes bacterium]|nr:DUF1543 domain-containing protein [Bacteroidota bacterium]
MKQPQLFMLLLGCRPPGRHTEQHDVFFGIGNTVKDLVPQIKAFWPGSGPLHVDAWREVSYVDGYRIAVVPREQEVAPTQEAPGLFFINLGGYKEAQFDEFHYKMIVVALDKAAAAQRAKQTAFYKHTGFRGAASHIDDQWGVDVDELHRVTDILSPGLKQQYRLQITPAALTAAAVEEDLLHLGYFKLHKL